MSEVLFLSHWDAAIPIIIPHAIVKCLTNYHILGIRFLYNCFQKGNRGAILNEVQYMNPYIQVSSFLNAVNSSISIESPAIIVCTADLLRTWHYYLSNYAGNAVVILSEQNSEQIMQGNSMEIILSTIENLKWLKGAELDFFTVIIDEVDLLINKRFVKQIKGQFHIGITTRNFLLNPDQKLLRNILLWSNPGSFGKLEQFCQDDDDHFNNNRFAYGNYWLRLTWSFCDSFKKPTEDELKINREIINKWANENNLHNTSIENSKQTVIRKRKRVSVVIEEDSKSEECTKIGANELEQTKCEPLISEVEDSTAQCVSSSQKTISYDYTNDDYPILTAIVNDSDIKEESESVSVVNKMDVYSSLFEEGNDEEHASSENILLAIMNDDFKHSDSNEHSNLNISSTKDDVMSMLYSDSE